MNRILKKVLTAEVLALMTCTSMSAMAEPQWVFVADVVPGSQSVDSGDKGFDKICEYYAQQQSSSSWPVIYDGTYDLTLLKDHDYIALICFGEDHLNNRDWFPAKFSCPWNLEGTEILGTFSLDHLDGCYEFKEPNPVPPMEENDPICEGKGYKDDVGGVACDSSCTGSTCGKDSARTCVWVIHPYFTTGESRARYSYCVRMHEQQHIDDWDAMGSYCDSVPDTKDRKATPRPNLFLSEYRAYQDSIRCFEEQKEQCNTKSCADQMQGGVTSSTENMEKARTRYENSCKPNCVPLN